MLESYVPRETAELILAKLLFSYSHHLHNANRNKRAMLMIERSVSCCGANVTECKHFMSDASKTAALLC